MWCCASQGLVLRCVHNITEKGVVGTRTFHIGAGRRAGLRQVLAQMEERGGGNQRATEVLAPSGYTVVAPVAILDKRRDNVLVIVGR